MGLSNLGESGMHCSAQKDEDRTKELIVITSVLVE